MSSLSIVILAAGKGTRMKSRRPKVLHLLAGKPLLGHVISTAQALDPEQTVVVTGHESAQVKDRFRDQELVWVEQEEQKGTGHAVQQCLGSISGDITLVLYGDVPLLTESTLSTFLTSLEDSHASILTMDKPKPTGYGRIIRDTDTNQPSAIVEEKDATELQRIVCEVNTGVLVAKTDSLKNALSKLNSDNAQGELYLTDVVEILVSENKKVNAFKVDDCMEAEGVNSRNQLEMLERLLQTQLAEQLMVSGVSVADKTRIDVRGSLTSGTDTYIDVNCIFEGQVVLGENVTIGPNCHLKDCSIGSDTELLANTVVESSTIGDSCNVGPFARVRPGTVLENGSKLGNFVETKNSHIGQGSKVNHLSYVGDCVMGDNVNIGAGTITCNYDGAYKHQTSIGDNVFVGSNTALVAPITIGDNATIGAGTTLSSNAPADNLTYSRSPAKSTSAWKRPVKNK